MRLLTAIGAIILALPASIEACAVCGLSGTRDSWLAYLVMTLVMSALPLVMIGGVAFWVYRRSKAA